METQILSTVPFRFKGIHSCDAIVAAPISFNFAREILEFVEVSLKIRAFDLFNMPSFSKKLAEGSATVTSSLDLASSKHGINHVVLFKHTDVGPYGSRRFGTAYEEDCYHKLQLLDARRRIVKKYRDVQVRMVYARLVNDDAEIEFAEVFEDGRERVRLVTDYRFKDVFHVETAVLMCMDFRFRRESRACVRYSLDHEHFEIIGLPGASKRFIEQSSSAQKAIQHSVRNHGVKRFVLIHHADCGAYGGRSSCGDLQEEFEMHVGEMESCERFLLEQYPFLSVDKVYAKLIEGDEQIQYLKIK